MRTLRELRCALCDNAIKSVVDIMPVSMFSCLSRDRPRMIGTLVRLLSVNI